MYRPATGRSSVRRSRAGRRNSSVTSRWYAVDISKSTPSGVTCRSSSETSSDQPVVAQRAGARPPPKKRPANTIRPRQRPGGSRSRPTARDFGRRSRRAGRPRARAGAGRRVRATPRFRRARGRQVSVKTRIAASIGLAQLTLAPYGFASIHSSSMSRTTSACRSSPSSMYAWPAGRSHCRREISQGIFTSLGRSSCAYSRSRHHAGGQVVPDTTSVCQSAGRSRRNGPLPRRSSLRSPPALRRPSRSRSPGATRSSCSPSTGSRNGQLRAAPSKTRACGRRARRQRTLVEPTYPRRARDRSVRSRHLRPAFSEHDARRLRHRLPRERERPRRHGRLRGPPAFDRPRRCTSRRSPDAVGTASAGA